MKPFISSVVVITVIVGVMAVVVIAAVVVGVVVVVVRHPINSHRMVIQTCQVQGLSLIYLVTTGAINILVTGVVLSVLPGNTFR